MDVNDRQVIHALGIDDAYTVDRVLASGPGGVTELVSLDGSGPFIRKRIPSKLARRGVWAMLAECGCARLPRVVATYEMPDEFVVVCDFVPGENLEEFVAGHGRIGEKDACTIVAQLCEAVAALHAHGIIHRDISPSNIVMAADGVHLIDLGIARFRTEGVTHDTTQLGTRGFASPEQCGYAQTDARSDVYSLGRVLGYLLTGVRPETPDTAEYERALADESVVGAGVREVVRRASALEPSARYQSVAELARALGSEKVVEAEAIADPMAPPAFKPAPRRRNWAKVLLAVMAVVAFVAAVGIILAVTIGRGGEKAGGPADAPAAESPVNGEGADGEPGAETGGGDAPAASDDSAGGEAPEELTADLEIVESGWSVGEDGRMSYVFALRNNSDNVKVKFPTVSIVGRADDGTIVYTREELFTCIYPGETLWGATIAGENANPDDVEFSIVPLRDDQVVRSDEKPPLYSVSNLAVVDSEYGLTPPITGEVSLLEEGNVELEKYVAIVLVFMDEDGTVIGGEFTSVNNPRLGESMPFSVYPHSCPDYSSYEAYGFRY